MSQAYGDTETGRSGRLDRILAELVGQVPEIEAASVVSFDGLAMAAALPAEMDEDRVAAMSAALLSLGERAAEGLGRGALSQVFIEGENGTVFLISADDEAVLVAVAEKGAKTGLMLFEVRRAAAVVAEILRVEDADEPEPEQLSAPAVPLQAVSSGGFVEAPQDESVWSGNDNVAWTGDDVAEVPAGAGGEAAAWRASSTAGWTASDSSPRTGSNDTSWGVGDTTSWNGSDNAVWS